MNGRNIEAEVTALKGLVVGILCVLADRDADLVREIIAACPSRPGNGNVTVINPQLEAVQVALDDILDHLRNSLGTEQNQD